MNSRKVIWNFQLITALVTLQVPDTKAFLSLETKLLTAVPLTAAPEDRMGISKGNYQQEHVNKIQAWTWKVETWSFILIKLHPSKTVGVRTIKCKIPLSNEEERQRYEEEQEKNQS